VLAEQALAAHVDRLVRSGGNVLTGRWVEGVDVSGGGVRVRAGDQTLDADAVVLAPGPGASGLLRALDVALELRPVLEQVSYLVGRAGWEGLPCLFDGPRDGEPGLYAMATPPLGYKVGLDLPLRAFDPADDDRTPVAAVTATIAARARRDLGWVEPAVATSQVCTWTDSPDGRFVVDRLHDGRVVLACGDSGEGFKFSALMGPLLADLVEGHDADPDLATFGLGRFTGQPSGVAPASPHVLGR
jgi:sarcosine oxidase